MAATIPSNHYGSTELFRYVKLKQPKIIDLQERAKKFTTSATLLEKGQAEQEDWAKSFVSSGKVINSEADLAYDYFSPLKITQLPKDKLPSKGSIVDLQTFAATAANLRSHDAYKEDVQNTFYSLLAYRILGDEQKTKSLTKLLNFVDLYPNLHKASQKRKYAPSIANRAKTKVSVKTNATSQPATDAVDRQAELSKLAANLSILWDAKQHELQEARSKLEHDKNELTNQPARRDIVRKKSSAQSLNKEKATAYQQKIRERKSLLLESKSAYKAKVQDYSLYRTLSASSTAYFDHFSGKNSDAVEALQEETKYLLDKYQVQPQQFYQSYEAVLEMLDASPQVVTIAMEDTCFIENPSLVFDDSIRILGSGELIRVEETFLKYTPSEISYIENILAGEVRKREVKNTKYVEQLSERITKEIFDSTKESGSRVSNELSNQIDQEISTRFSSDLNSSINASGGGSIGLVDIEGGATVNAGIGVGIDTSFSSSSTSNFSQEILNKAIEKTKKTTIEKRLDKTYALYETLNYHEINNTLGGEIKSRNGIYCFLDKHICVSEIPYGYRIFLLANLSMPGKNLLCEKKAKLKLALSDLGARPEFDISPNDVRPDNYKSLAGKFKAYNVQPPPSPLLTLGKTYKSDSSNANVEQNEISFKKVAEVLVPFFARYKRFLIADNIRLPDGYRVREVVITVNHGSNGLSIPAHLPLSLAGATLYATPTLAAGTIFPPYFMMGLWQVGYLISPILHYNTDSSKVTACIGNESQDSAYYFFEPEFLIREIFDFLSNFSSMAPELLDQIQTAANTLYTKLQENATNLPTEVGEFVSQTVTGLITRIQNVFNQVYDALNLLDGDLSVDLVALRDELQKLVQFSVEVPQDLVDLMNEFFTPLQDFIRHVFELIQIAMQEALSDLFSFLTGLFDNSQNLFFANAKGVKKELPVSFNMVAMNPGVTINMSIHMERTEEALDRWRLETFNSLYQSYLQQLAEWDSRAYTNNQNNRASSSPGIMRQEEHLAIKELVLHVLNNVDGNNGNSYSLEKINLFENAIDWKNISYRLYNYGPNLHEIQLEKIGAYADADERRKSFLKALWAQVLIPLHEHEHLEKQILQYFETSAFNIEADLSEEELVALYTDVIHDREQVTDPDLILSTTKIVPTELVIIQDDLPENQHTRCS